MESPLITSEKKTALVNQILAPVVDELTATFVRLLIEKGREDILAAVGEEYRRQADVAKGLVRAQATVAFPLDDAQRDALIPALSKRTGMEIDLEIIVDPAIIGGVVVRLGDTVIDGSVRGALERLRERMLLER